MHDVRQIGKWKRKEHLEIIQEHTVTWISYLISGGEMPFSTVMLEWLVNPYGKNYNP